MLLCDPLIHQQTWIAHGAVGADVTGPILEENKKTENKEATTTKLPEDKQKTRVPQWSLWQSLSGRKPCCMIRGFFDEVLVAERQFQTGKDVLDPVFTPGSGGGATIDNKAYRQLRFAKLDMCKAQPISSEQIRALDVVRL